MPTGGGRESLPERAGPVLMVFARLPEPGRVKTRLIPEVGAQAATELHAAFLQDTLVRVARLSREVEGTPVLAWTGAGRPEETLEDAGVAGFVIRQQCSGDLGARILDTQQAVAPDRVSIALGSDSPTLPGSIVEEALHALQAHDAALSPAADGGYTLLGTARPQPVLLRGIPWGGDDVLNRSLGAAREAGLSVKILPEWYDIDDADGLRRLAADIAPAPERAPRTHAAFRRLPERVLRSLQWPT